MLNVFAHVKWFSEGGESTSMAGLSSTEWVVVAMCIAAGVGLMQLANKLFKSYDRKLDENLRRFRDWVPTVVRLSTAALIVFNFWSGYLFAPNIAYSEGLLSVLINSLLILVAVMLLFGTYVRLAGLLLLAAFGLAVPVVSEPVQLLDHLEYIGLGLYLLLVGTGALSVSNLKDPLDKFKSSSALGIPLLKTFVGLGLIALAFSEKLLNMSLSNDFLAVHDWNVLSGFGMSDRNFIIMAAIIEILIGLTLILNKASRLGTLVLLVTMILTAALLGIEEVFGHMFAVAVVAVVLVGPNESLFKKRSS